MALSISTCSSNLRPVALYSKPSLPQPHFAAVPHPPKPSIQPLVYSNRTPHPHPCLRPRAQENPDEGSTEPEEQSPSEEGSMTEVAAELKQMLKEKKERESQQQQQDENLLMGVAQEVREIEWPDLGKVLGTTGVVLAVIAGSTAALLSVNAVLAEISDRVFAGKGIQDFF